MDVMDAKQGNTPLQWAFRVGNDEVAKVLTRKGASLSRHSYATSISPLQLAIEDGNTDIMHLLIEKKADVHERDPFGKTAILVALEKHGSSDR